MIVDDRAGVNRGLMECLPPEIRGRLVKRYQTPTRYYHTIQHASFVAEQVRLLGGDRGCLIAAWFHDVVYDAMREDNEERSATLLEGWMPDDPDTPTAARLVRLTASHAPEPGDRQGEILCDADLAVLGQAPPDYEEYRRAVRREFSHVSDPDWRTGRAKVIAEFLGRDRLYLTAVGHTQWGAGARHNLTAELTTLT